LVIWTLHFTSFGSSTPIPSTSGTPITTSPTRSFFSEGNSGGGGGIAGTSGGIILDPVNLYEVSWDKCDANIMRIVVGNSDNDLSVKLRTHAGLVKVSLATDQPYEDKSIYEAIIKQDVTFAQIQIESLSTSNPSLYQKSFDLRECEGSDIVITEPEKLPLQVIQQISLMSSILENISPRNQIALGLAPDSVVCKAGLELMFKASNGSPACVTNETLEKLIQRGWGHT